MKAFLKRFREGAYIGDFVYGANDGIVTTFAVVAGATGALLSSGVVLILGLASLGADAFSMGASNFLAIRSEKELERKRKLQEGHTELPRNDVITPVQHGLVTFGAFMAAGAVPLAPYLFPLASSDQFFISSGLAVAAFFAIGGTRTLITGGHFGKGGFEMLLVGGVAAGVAFAIGWAVKTIFGIAVQ